MPSEPPRPDPMATRAYPHRQAGETDLAYARRAIDPGDLPANLPDVPALYFAVPAGTTWVALDRLCGREPVLADATFWHNAAARPSDSCDMPRTSLLFVA